MDNKYGKKILVTGASSGIGKACALKFAKNGCQVVGVSRAIDEGTETFPGGGTLARKRLDITDEATAKDFIESLPDIDIAILCAGMGVAGPAESTPMELTRRQMEVNYFGTLNVAGPVLKRMREKGRGLLIIIGSIAGRVPIPMQSQYSSSKYALEAYVDAVRMEMKRFGVKATIIEPGDTKTGFTDARVTDESEGGTEAYGSVVRKSVAKMARDEQKGRGPESVAKVAWKLACKADPPARVPVGFEYKALMQLLRIMPDRAKEAILSKMYLPK